MDQPRLFDVDKEAPHVDTYEPGLLNEDQWGARSDVWHHGSESPAWKRPHMDDPLMHLGTPAAAAERSTDYTYRFRVPDHMTYRPREGAFSDGGANLAHSAYNQRHGYAVPESVSDSVSDLPSDGPPVTQRTMNVLRDGEALIYKNAAEDAGSESLLVSQSTPRLWSEDVQQQAASGERKPLPMTLSKAQFLGTSSSEGEGRKVVRGAHRQQSMLAHNAGFSRDNLALLGSKPLTETTLGGGDIDPPLYEADQPWKLGKVKEKASQRLAQDMNRLLG